MPVKVRCRQCEKVFAAPDRARGKAVRCPGCREPVKVPAGKTKEPGGKEAAGNDEGDSFFASLDLSQAEDKTARLCPKCASEVRVDDRICPECHVNLETGVVSSRMQKRLKRKGPNPVLFYKAAWADSWRFMLANQRLVIQTWIVNIGIALLQAGMVFVGFWIVVTFLPPIPSDFEMMVQGNQPKEEEPYKVPLLSQLLLADGYVIMTGLTSLLYLIITGWIWTMAVQITRTTMARKTEAKRLSFQLVDSLANGFKMYFWGIIFPLPVMIIAIPAMLLLAVGVTALSAGNAPAAGALMAIPVLVIAGSVNLVIVLSIPSALAHFAQKHTYKAWSLPLMAFTALRNIAPTLYLGLIGLVALIVPVAVFVGGVVIVQFVLKEQFGPPHLLAWTKLVGFEGASEGAVSNVTFPWKAVAGYLGTIIIGSLVGAYAMIFWMRAVGLYAYYFQQRLGLVRRTLPGQLAGFWARYIAVLVDILIIAVVGWLFEPIELWKMNEKGKLLSLLMAGLAIFFVTKFGFVLGIGLGYLALLPLCGFSYFARSECSKEQATLGKEAVGIMVTGPNGERLTFTQSGLRAVLKLFLWIGSFLAGFTPKKQALHDMAAGTLVVFRGDLDRE